MRIAKFACLPQAGISEFEKQYFNVCIPQSTIRIPHCF